MYTKCPISFAMGVCSAVGAVARNALRPMTVWSPVLTMMPVREP
jgi:hypothetical protein